ncbi:MAG TPA: hypothetical protein VJ487_16155 [Alphaproteobacteria bacterium]|nr:hypothetical protein [Alphaproteobacteria bacterium]
MSDDVDALGAYLKRAKRAVARFAGEPQIRPHFETLKEAEAPYMEKLRTAKVKVGPKLRRIEMIVGTLEGAARSRDIAGVTANLIELMSALPGGPVRGLPPPKPRIPALPGGPVRGLPRPKPKRPKR